MKIDCADYPLMKVNCKTCPFKIIDGRMQDAELQNNNGLVCKFHHGRST